MVQRKLYKYRGGSVHHQMRECAVLCVRYMEAVKQAKDANASVSSLYYARQLKADCMHAHHLMFRRTAALARTRNGFARFAYHLYRSGGLRIIDRAETALGMTCEVTRAAPVLRLHLVI